MKNTDKIKTYRFQDSIDMLQATAYGNLLLALLLAFPDPAGNLENVHLQACLFSFVVFVLAHRNYDWKNQQVNFVFLFVYLGIALAEYLLAGLPGYPLRYDFESYELSRGFMFDLLVWMLPYAYAGIRVGMVIPILAVVRNRYQLDRPA